MEVGGIFHIPNLDNWQGSYSTGGGAPLPRKKKEEEKPEPESDAKEGITQDPSGVVHVDVVA
jgi:hypothetical protein